MEDANDWRREIADPRLAIVIVRLVKPDDDSRGCICQDDPQCIGPYAARACSHLQAAVRCFPITDGESGWVHCKASGSST